MPYKLNTGLSPEPSLIDVADFWEIECLKRKDGSTSVTDIKKILQICDDVQEPDDDEEELKSEGFLDDISSELHRRFNSCGENYPFSFDAKGYNFSFKEGFPEDIKWLYIYLLLATRHKMDASRISNGIDGSLLFESVCKDILTEYFGKYSKGYIFGTENRQDGFYNKLEELVKEFGEGEIRKKQDLTYIPQDDKLDVVAWIPFLDGQPSKLICFGQCKTGTSWIDQTEQLRADSFIKKWFSRAPSLTPIDAFMIADIVDPRDFYNRSVNRLFFDRCRVMNFAIKISERDWYESLKTWCKGILDRHNIHTYNLED
jgi:hypothetical protein